MVRKPSYEELEQRLAELEGRLSETKGTESGLERELARDSEARLRFMVETTGDVIYRLAYDSMNYDYVSPGIVNLTGYSREEIMGLGFSRLVGRIDLPGKENVAPSVIVRDRLEGKTGEYRADYLIATKTGEPKWVRDHSFPWRDAEGNLVGSVGILSDVTEYKQAEALLKQRTAELVESEEKYRTLVENVPLVVYRAGPAGEVVFINRFAEELLGYGPMEILRDPGLWAEAIHEQDRGRVNELREKTWSEGREFIAEYRIVHRNGCVIHVTDHAMPFRTPEGAVGGVDGIIMDVTGRVKLQEKLIQSEGLKTISEVSARLAHEIRNPLVSAGGFARRLLSSMDTKDPNREKVEIIVREVSRLEVILRMVLNYIQPFDLELQPIDPGSLVEAALRGIEADAKKRDISIRAELPEGLPKITVDRLQMKQVLKSLLKKALGRMPDGAALSISAGLENDMLRIAVRYPVRNLSQDDVEHFFYPFTTDKPDYPAADLPMSKIIVHKHGGVIEVQNEKPGKILIKILLPV